jgi:GntR family transcriptional regulator/MocR family aminotransferase
MDNLNSLALTIERHSREPLTMQIYTQLRQIFLTGTIPSGCRLPSVRRLAAQLEVSRNTVETAYAQLVAEGYVEGREKSGYFALAVTHQPRVFSADGKIDAAVGQNDARSATASSKTLPRSSDSATFPQIEYDFTDSSVDLTVMDMALWRRYVNRALKEAERFSGPVRPQGEPELIEAVTRHAFESRGAVCLKEQVIIGAGIQSLLHLLCALIPDHYTRVGFEEPGFRQARQIFADHRFLITPIGVDSQGIDLEALAASQAEITCVSPSHQFPLGSAMPVARRAQLLAWAARRRGIIVEDDYDSELSHVNRPLPSLQGMDRGEHVVYIGSFSKLLFPALRISYMILTPSLAATYHGRSHLYNQTASKIEQLALANYMREGQLGKQVRKLRKVYARKADILQTTIQQEWRGKAKIFGKSTGSHLLIEIDSPLSAERIVQRAEENSVAVLPVEHFYTKNQADNRPRLLLSFAGITEALIPEGIRRLAKSCSE